MRIGKSCETKVVLESEWEESQQQPRLNGDQSEGRQRTDPKYGTFWRNENKHGEKSARKDPWEILKEASAKE